MNCSDCGTEMIPLAIPGSGFCPNDCDRKPKEAAAKASPFEMEEGLIERLKHLKVDDFIVTRRSLIERVADSKVGITFKAFHRKNLRAFGLLVGAQVIEFRIGSNSALDKGEVEVERYR